MEGARSYYPGAAGSYMFCSDLAHHLDGSEGQTKMFLVAVSGCPKDMIFTMIAAGLNDVQHGCQLTLREHGQSFHMRVREQWGIIDW